MQRIKLAVAAAAAAVLVTVGIGTRYSEARANPSVSAVYLWKDLNGKCPALCDRNSYACPCMAAAREPVE